jgi:hypothetical protein
MSHVILNSKVLSEMLSKAHKGIKREEDNYVKEVLRERTKEWKEKKSGVLGFFCNDPKPDMQDVLFVRHGRKYVYYETFGGMDWSLPLVMAAHTEKARKLINELTVACRVSDTVHITTGDLKIIDYFIEE